MYRQEARTGRPTLQQLQASFFNLKAGRGRPAGPPPCPLPCPCACALAAAKRSRAAARMVTARVVCALLALGSTSALDNGLVILLPPPIFNFLAPLCRARLALSLRLRMARVVPPFRRHVLPPRSPDNVATG